MIRTLQRRFVVTSMAAVSVLLLILLGTINLINIAMVRDEVNQTLSMLSEAEGDFGHLPKPQEPMPPPDFGLRPKSERDVFLSSNFFVVRLNEDGQVIGTDVSRTAQVDEAGAQQLALDIFRKERKTGRAGIYRYRVQNTPDSRQTVLVFLDTSNEIFSYARVLLLSAGIGIVVWLLMLPFVMMLSKKAIRPIVESMEKQKQFVTNAGHEIKTPLAIILANTEAMELYHGASKWSRNIREQTARLDGLTKNLLLLAKMEEHAAEPSMSDIRFGELAAERVQDFAESLKLGGVTLQSHIQSDITLHGNREQLSQLLSILLDNAVKYTNPGGSVSVSLQQKGKHIILQVENSCASLPEAPAEKLFDRFYRDNGARTQKTGGYGIGLSVAQAVARTHKADITAHYEKMPDRVVITVRF